MKRHPNYHIAVLLAAAAGLAACSSRDHNDSPPPPAANTAPSISAINDKAADQDTVVPVEFGITDSESALDTLTLTVAADSNAVFPSDGIVVSGTGPTKTLTLTFTHLTKVLNDKNLTFNNSSILKIKITSVQSFILLNYICFIIILSC